MPFKNQTDDPTISNLFYRIFLDTLIEEAHFEIIPEGQIRRILILERYTGNKEISRSLINAIRKRTGADALIIGEILESNRKELKLSVLIYAIDTSSGKLLWTTYYSKTGEDYRKVLHFGRPFTMTKLAKNMADDILYTWNEEHLGGCW
ncbi:hypothetical protein [Thermodesulfatator atlanticus]|uniref:hypothetical protein n=1 Tax=Thermodesulfatator atlanticus TaxID=501497 RepID=UPI0003B75350|nr:hypothetical protein [Thermodesulfatator atlanticus]